MKQQSLLANLAYLNGYILAASRSVSNKLSKGLAKFSSVNKQPVSGSAKPALSYQASSQPSSAPVKNVQPPSNEVTVRKSYIDERFFESFLRAQQSYVPKPYKGQVDFFPIDAQYLCCNCQTLQPEIV